MELWGRRIDQGLASVDECRTCLALPRGMVQFGCLAALFLIQVIAGQRLLVVPVVLREVQPTKGTSSPVAGRQVVQLIVVQVVTKSLGERSQRCFGNGDGPLVNGSRCCTVVP